MIALMVKYECKWCDVNCTASTLAMHFYGRQHENHALSFATMVWGNDMDMIKKAGLLVGTAALATAAIIGYRTISFAPVDTSILNAVTLAKLPPFDIDTATANLGAAIRFQTISHQDKAENKIDQWDRFHAWLQTTYPESHRKMQREIVGERALLYRWQGSDPSLEPIILMAHQDVVPVTEGTEKDWKYPPFSGQIAENAVWGRGSVDDKGSLIGLFEAFEALAKSGFIPKRSIYLVSGHDEEAGGTGAKAIADLLSRQGIKALFTIDEGSAVVRDAPIINGPAIMIGIAEKGYATLRLTAKAPGGHSSMPPKETGVVNLAKAIVAINASPFPSELKGPGVEMIGALAARGGGLVKMAAANPWAFSGVILNTVGKTPSGAAMFHTTIAPTMLQGSPKENVLPQTATALINYRIAPWNSSADVMARAKAAVGALPVMLDWVNSPREPSPVASTKSSGWGLIAAAAAAQNPGAPIAPYLVVAGTDSRNFSGVSRDVYRFMPAQFTIKETGMIHGTNEHMTIENLSRMINFYAQLIKTSAG
jgi:carboxypeptidase PM20D1